MAHTLVVLAAVPGLLTVGVTVAHGFSLGVLKTLVVPAGAAVRALPLPAARLGPRNKLPAEEGYISTEDEPEAHRAPSARSHDGTLVRLPSLRALPLLVAAFTLLLTPDLHLEHSGGFLYARSQYEVSASLTPRRATEASKWIQCAQQLWPRRPWDTAPQSCCGLLGEKYSSSPLSHSLGCAICT